MTPDTGHTEQQSRHVCVTLDERMHTASIRLLGDWRSEGVAGLGAAVLRALTLTMQEHMLAALAAGLPPTTVPPATVLPATRRECDDLLDRAIRELDEFRIALTELSTAAETVQDPGGHVTVRIRQSAIVQIDLDGAWIGLTRDSAVESTLSSALSMALTRIPNWPARALRGCPDLQSILQTAGSPLATATNGTAR